MNQEQQQQQQQQHHDYQHLAQISESKLDSTKYTLRHQLLIRNVLISSINLIKSNQTSQEEHVWLDACFDQLMGEEDQDALMEEDDEDENLLVMAFPFEYSEKERKAGTIFFMQV